MPSPKELVAHGRTEPEIAEAIGADLVIYQTLEDLVQSCRSWNPEVENFDCSVFNGEYVTGGVDDRYLEHLDKLRSDNAKSKKKSVTLSEAEEVSNGCSGPMSESSASSTSTFFRADQIDGADSLITMTRSDSMSRSDSLIGLSNHSPKLGAQNMASPNDAIGLHNSWYGA